MLRLPSNLTWRFLGYTVTIEHHNLGTFGGLWKRVKYVAVYFREQRELWQAIRLVNVRCNVWNNCNCPFILQTLFYKGLKAISLGSRDLYCYFTIWTCPISSVSYSKENTLIIFSLFSSINEQWNNTHSIKYLCSSILDSKLVCNLSISQWLKVETVK